MSESRGGVGGGWGELLREEYYRPNSSQMVHYSSGRPMRCLSPSSTRMHGRFSSVVACALTRVVRSETTLPGCVPSVYTFRTHMERPDSEFFS